MANHIQSELLILPCNFFCVLYKRFEHTGLVADPCRGVSYIAAMAPSRLSFILHAFNRCWDHTYEYVFFFTPDSQNTWMLLLVLPKFAIKVLRCHAPLSLIYILSAITNRHPKRFGMQSNTSAWPCLASICARAGGCGHEEQIAWLATLWSMPFIHPAL